MRSFASLSTCALVIAVLGACDSGVTAPVTQSPQLDVVTTTPSGTTVETVDLGELGLGIAINNNEEAALIQARYVSEGFERATYYWSAQTGPVPVGTLGGLSTNAQDISEDGTIVGTSLLQDHNYPLHGFSWNKDSGLDDLSPGVLYGPALGINDLGEKVGGRALTYTDYVVPIRWDADGTPHRLATVDNVDVQAVRINDLGQVAGDGLWRDHLYFWSSDQSLYEIPPLDPSDAMREVRGFNNLGQVVGLSGPSATDFSAFCWSEETGTVRVDLGSQLGFAQDINDAGHIAGNHYLADGSVRAVFWSKETGPIDLPPLPGGATSVSFGMNGHDVVIGNSLAADGTEHTVIWRVRVPASAGTVLGSLTNEVESATFGGHGDVGVGRSLLAKLAAVGAAMRKGQSTAAIHQVGAFVNQVEALHRSGRLAGATADSLEGNAENLIQLLSQN